MSTCPHGPWLVLRTACSFSAFFAVVPNQSSGLRCMTSAIFLRGTKLLLASYFLLFLATLCSSFCRVGVGERRHLESDAIGAFPSRYDDYDYGEVNQLLERNLKVYIKTVACYPEKTTRRMYNLFWRHFRHSEKVQPVGEEGVRTQCGIPD